jgi:hypothetical protein
MAGTPPPVFFIYQRDFSYSFEKRIKIGGIAKRQDGQDKGIFSENRSIVLSFISNGKNSTI